MSARQYATDDEKRQTHTDEDEREDDVDAKHDGQRKHSADQRRVTRKELELRPEVWRSEADEQKQTAAHSAARGMGG